MPNTPQGLEVLSERDNGDDGDDGDDGEPVVLPLRLVALLPIQARSWRSKSAALGI